MAQAIYVQRGDIIDYTPSTDVAAGDVIVQGAIVGIAVQSIAANAVGALHVAGVFDVVKQSTTTFAVGDLVYWDATNKVAVSEGTILLGKAVAAAGDTVTTVRVRLSS